MQKTRIILAFSILILATLACNILTPNAEPTSTMVVIVEPTFPTYPPPDLPQTEDEVPRASLEMALTAYAAGAATFVDVRSVDEYAASHIPGAINVPLDQLELNPIIVALDQEQWVITYASASNEDLSAQVAFRLLHNGYEKVTPLLGGFEAWVQAGNPIEP